jgi:hypothetical protein
MRLLLHDTLATMPWTVPLREGWLPAPAGVEVLLRPDLPAAAVGAGEAALLPSPEAALLEASHAVWPTAAAVFSSDGPVSLRTPVRPDEVERTPVRLTGCSAAGELLARATLRTFYGIEPAAWTRDDDPAAEAVVLEGTEALRPAEGGFAEDLARAFFIMTGLPAVTHLLVVPDPNPDPTGDGDRAADATAGAAGSPLDPPAAEPAALAAAFDWLQRARVLSHERRKEWRGALVAGGVASDKLGALFASMRTTLEPDDRKALTALLSHGARGTAYPTAPRFRIVELPAGG